MLIGIIQDSAVIMMCQHGEYAGSFPHHVDCGLVKTSSPDDYILGRTLVIPQLAHFLQAHPYIWSNIRCLITPWKQKQATSTSTALVKSTCLWTPWLSSKVQWWFDFLLNTIPTCVAPRTMSQLDAPSRSYFIILLGIVFVLYCMVTNLSWLFYF